jgi:hypothetical protein
MCSDGSDHLNMNKLGARDTKISVSFMYGNASKSFLILLCHARFNDNETRKERKHAEKDGFNFSIF